MAVELLDLPLNVKMRPVFGSYRIESGFSPVAGWLMITGHIGRGLGVVVWGAVLIVGVADYVIRPKLLGSKVKMNELLVFVAIFGGIEAFGLLGLILGPIFVALFVSLVRIYEREYKPADL